MLHNIKKGGERYYRATLSTAGKHKKSGVKSLPRQNYLFFSAVYVSVVFTVICDTVSPFVTYCDEVVTTRETLQEDKPNKIPSAVAIADTRYTIALFQLDFMIAN